MPRNPRQLSINPNSGGINWIFNPVIPFDIPLQSDTTFWRQIAYRQPIVMDCLTTLVMFAQSLQWDIRAKDPTKQDELKDKIEEHKDILVDAGGKGYLNHLAHVVQDLYLTKFGAGSETLRYSDKTLYKIFNIDSATLYPNIYEPEKPVIQKVGTETIKFNKDEIV
jgi:hypothetical protein